jgi:hypothetical protein
MQKSLTTSRFSQDVRSLLRYVLFAIACLIPAMTFAQQKVLIIGIDGCRHDALRAANTPHLDALIAESVYSYDALTEPPTWSGVGWSAMLTGVWRNKHGVTDNTFSGNQFADYPHFMKRVEAFDPSLFTVSISHWAPINTQIVGGGGIDLILSPSTDSLVGAAAVDVLQNQDPDVIFLQFDDVDHAGHGSGFSMDVPAYMAAIESVDRFVGYIIAALQSRPNYAQEDWLIIGSTDHGGIGNSHGGASFIERNIFFFASKAGRAAAEISKTTVITNTNCMPDTMGLRMAGASDYASVPNNALFQFGSSQDFTIELRIKTSGWTGDPSFVGNKNWDSGINKGFVISSPINNQSNWKVNVGDGSNRADITGSDIADNRWHHLAAVFDRDGLLRLFKDGLPDGSTNMAQVTGSINNTLSLAIGQDGTLSYGSAMNGLISEVRIWKTLVNEATLAAWQCRPLDGSHPHYADLVGYWRMNEGSGQQLADSSPHGLHATYNGSAADWELVNLPDTTYDYNNTPRIVDVATTALAHLCVPIQESWGLDGSVIGVEVPNPQISGSTLVCEQMQESYSVTSNGIQPLSWSVTNGAILAGADSTTVIVQWGNAGAGSLRVVQCNVQKVFPVTVDVCSASHETVAPADYSLYPNPTRGVFTVSASEAGSIRRVGIRDALGREILAVQPISGRVDIDLSKHSKGLYWVLIEDNNARLTKLKLVLN